MVDHGELRGHANAGHGTPEQPSGQTGAVHHRSFRPRLNLVSVLMAWLVVGASRVQGCSITYTGCNGGYTQTCSQSTVRTHARECTRTRAYMYAQ